jgi:hypothetical protein
MTDNEGKPSDDGLPSSFNIDAVYLVDISEQTG